MSLWIFGQIKIISLLLACLFLYSTTEELTIIDCALYMHEKLCNICNQSSFLILQTLLFNIKLTVSLIPVSGHLFHPNTCFDFWSRICLGIPIHHTIWKLAYLDFYLWKFHKTQSDLWKGCGLLASAFFKNGNAQGKRKYDKWF